MLELDAIDTGRHADAQRRDAIGGQDLGGLALHIGDRFDFAPRQRDQHQIAGGRRQAHALLFLQPGARRADRRGDRRRFTQTAAESGEQRVGLVQRSQTGGAVCGFTQRVEQSLARGGGIDITRVRLEQIGDVGQGGIEGLRIQRPLRRRGEHAFQRGAPLRRNCLRGLLLGQLLHQRRGIALGGVALTDLFREHERVVDAIRLGQRARRI